MLWMVLGAVQFGFANEGAKDPKSLSIPEPVVVLSDEIVKTQSSGTLLGIERVSGCFGALEQARQNVRPPEGLLVEPFYQSGQYVKGSFALVNPTCVLGDRPVGKAAFVHDLMDFEYYMYAEFECGCGSCMMYDPKAEYGVGETFDESEALERATEQHKKEYLVYKKQRTQELATHNRQYKVYEKDHRIWSARYSAEINNESVRVSITPSENLKSGVVTLYAFVWEQSMWCGDTASISRTKLVSREIVLPPMAKGETAHVWLHDVDSQASWGAVLHQDDSTESILRQIHQEADRRNDLPGFQQDLYGLPPVLQHRAIELTPGTNSIIYDDCCAC